MHLRLTGPGTDLCLSVIQYDNQNAERDSNRESRGSLCATKLAYTTVVPHSNKTDAIQTNITEARSSIASPTT